jgi:diguanylate cyclase (GGDEF)-like protein/PAS domain S-box-containing protein
LTQAQVDQTVSLPNEEPALPNDRAASPDGLGKRIHAWAIAASRELPNPEEKRRAELLTALLLGAIPLGVIAVIMNAVTRQTPLSSLELAQQIVSGLLMIVSYRLSRTVHFRLAAVLTTVVIMTWSWLALSHEIEAVRVVGLLATTVTGVLVSASILSTKVTIMLSLVNLAIAVSIPYIHPNITLELATPALWSLIFLTGLILTVSSIINQDLSDLQQRQSLLSESDERYELVANATNDALWDWSPRAAEMYYSPRWEALTGATGSVQEGLEWWMNKVHPGDISRLRQDMESHIAGHTAHLENTHRILHTSGEWRWVLARGKALHDAKGLTRIAGSISDVTESKRYEQRLLHDAFHDGLTGLPNRALLMDRLRLCSARSRRKNDYLFAVLFLDIDSFKLVNDSLGHSVGDQLLIHVSQRLGDCVRPNDTVARLGGDDFIILLDDIESVEDALQVAERIHLTLATPISLGGESISTLVSIGIAISDLNHERPEYLLRDADTAMYQSKAEGPGRTKLFERGMHATAVSRLHLENELRFAVERNELFLVFQPIVAMANMEVQGFEALVRWQHPERGLLSPMEFIPVAEETGVIDRIDEWVMNAACIQLSEWRTKFGKKRVLSMNVNVSGNQFRTQGLTSGVSGILQQTGLNPRDLQIELTETVIMDRAESSKRALSSLRDKGIRICIDDFGTGYSSLSYLDAFDLDGLKIDRSFIQSMQTTDGPPKIIQAIIDLGHNLGLGVTAEGVETKNQLDQLRAMGCDTAQGYLLSRPLSAHQAEALLEEPRIHF